MMESQQPSTANGIMLLPIANVGRLMKQSLPPNAKVSKSAKQTVQECATEFISFVTAEASDRCHKENRKTLNGDDICWALRALGFDGYAEAMIRYLHKYRNSERERAINTVKNLTQPQHQRPDLRHDLDHRDEAPPPLPPPLQLSITLNFNHT